MKGKIEIKCDGKQLQIQGHMGFRGKEEVLELMCAVGRVFDIESPAEWSAVALHAAVRDKSREHIETCELRIPKINREGEAQ